MLVEQSAEYIKKQADRTHFLFKQENFCLLKNRSKEA